MFSPIRCPYPKCEAHAIERLGDKNFCVGFGSYQPKCRPRPVPRFLCRYCDRTFSRQTFRQDYYDHKPHTNAPLLQLVAHGLGLRQSAGIVKLSRRCAEEKMRKMSRHLERFNKNMMDQLPEGCSFQMDEMETFENERRTQPLTLPVLIEQESMFIVDARSAPIRPSGRTSERRRKAIRERESVEGRRSSESRSYLKKVLRHTSSYTRKLSKVRIDTDEKSAYPGLLRWAFGPNHEHRTANSRDPRNTCSLLFPINHMNAMARYLSGRLRRRSWLASKMRQFLNLQLHLFMAYKNFVRPRFNGDKQTPAMVLGLVRERMAPTDLLSWRQDWGWFSPHPLGGRLTLRKARARDRRRGQAAFQTPVVRRGFAE